MTLRLSIIHTARLAVAASALTVLAGCNSGPHQQPPANSAVTHDPKDAKDKPTRNSGPHQHDAAHEPTVGSSGPHQ